jgi:two-component system sensor kinase FixL
VAVEALHLGAGAYLIKDVEGRYVALLPSQVARLLAHHRLGKQKRQAEAALRQTRAALARRLTARTAELQQANAQLQAEIAERTQAEAALAEREARTQAILETAVDGIITIDERGLIESCNPAAARLFGYTAAEVLGQNVRLLMPSPAREAHEDYIARYLRTGERQIIGIGREVLGQRKDGSTFPLDLAVSEVRLRDRRVFTGFVRDLTARKHAEQDMQRADRLALVGQLASGLAHEIGTPLNVIAGNAELLRQALLAQGQAVAELETIVAQADRITHLLERLLAFARARGQPRAPLALHTPLAHALRLLEPRFRREAIAVLVEMPPDLPLILGVADQLEQVFLNVLVNAWHAMPEGGTVTIVAGPTDADRVQIAVQDTGCGMSPETLAHACEPFYSTKGEHGTGLGLAICRQILDSHQGTLHLDSTPGTGTTVTITLPRAEAVE